MIDLEDRLLRLAAEIVVPPTDPGQDLARGRRRRRRHQWTVAGGAALAAASVVAVVGWGPSLVPGATPQEVGPADSEATRDLFATTDESSVGGPSPGPIESDLRASVESALGLEEAPLDVVMTRRPDYDPSGLVVSANTFMGVGVPGRDRVVQVNLGVARSWQQSGWRESSCYPGCDSYELDGRQVQTGTYADMWGWAIERTDGTVVTLELGADPDRLGVERAEVDRLLLEVVLPSERDEPAGWGDALLDMAMDHLPADGYSLQTGVVDLGPSLHATYTNDRRERGEVVWEGELLDTAPAGCPSEFTRCERRVIDGVEVTLKHIGAGIEEGYVWVEHDGARVRSRVLLEPYGDAWSVPLDRVAALLADPLWEQMPDSQSVTTG